MGSYNLTRMPLDVFPDFAPPQVEIQTEAPGLASEEVESLITLPIESAVNGTPGVETVRAIVLSSRNFSRARDFQQGH
ncbi:efflux RND transporter permease subunit [Leptodesmis sp.]|uniref:efflux RND transporter permease subunit n=1 Tax=Leptodesmis sp. TaxID=3100501 RepID=UPI0040534AD2